MLSSIRSLSSIFSWALVFFGEVYSINRPIAKVKIELEDGLKFSRNLNISQVGTNRELICTIYQKFGFQSSMPAVIYVYKNRTGHKVTHVPMNDCAILPYVRYMLNNDKCYLSIIDR